MKVVQIRSPFIITINESTQIASKVELFIWNYGDTVPTVPAYVMSKDIPSPTQKATYYNISNFISEYIDNYLARKVDTVTSELSKSWCLFKVKRYYNDGIYKIIDTTDYIGLNGFSKYTDGNQLAKTTNIKLLTNSEIKKNYNINSSYGYFNLLVDTTSNEYQIIYETSVDYHIYYVPTIAGVNLLKVPYSIVDVNSTIPCKITIYNVGDDVNEFIINTNPIEECKYTSVECSFINSFGGWEFLTFYKAQSNSINVKGSEYNLMPNKLDYSIYKGQSKGFNINGTQSVKLNTGFVDENYNELIHDLMLSETILLDSKPAKVKNKSFDYKTYLKDKNINFTIEFEYAFNLINDVV
jgi:hypothetical protein